MKRFFPIFILIPILFSCGTQTAGEVGTTAFYATGFIKTDPVDILRFHPVMAFDDDPMTAWAEGAKGPGIGEWIEITFTEKITVDGIGIEPGFFDPDKFENYNRLKRIKLIFSDSSEPVEVQFEDGMTVKQFSFEPRTIQSCSITILDVYSGGDGTVSCISDVSFFSKNRKYQLLNIDTFKDILEKNRDLQTPAGFKIVDGRPGGGVLYFFPDHTVLYRDDLRDKGTWAFDEEKNRILISLSQREMLEGTGDKITHRSASGTTVYFEDYTYRVTDINTTVTFNWKERRDRFLNNRGDDFHFYLLTDDDFRKKEFTERPEVLKVVERMKLIYDSLKKRQK